MSTRTQSFFDALTAIRTGTAAQLQALLTVAPALARARSTDHGTLLYHAAELGRADAVDTLLWR